MSQNNKIKNKEFIESRKRKYALDGIAIELWNETPKKIIDMALEKGNYDFAKLIYEKYFK